MLSNPFARRTRQLARLGKSLAVARDLTDRESLSLLLLILIIGRRRGGEVMAC